MNHLARGPVFTGFDNKAIAAGRRRGQACISNTAMEADR